MGGHRECLSPRRHRRPPQRLDRGFEIEATRELRDRYGQPEEVSYRGSQLLIWTMGPDGDGILAARLSSMDVQKDETPLSQIHNGLALAAGHLLKPSYALVAMRMSGGAKYEHRSDFEFIRHRVADQGARWVCYREPDRIAREQHSSSCFYKFLEGPAPSSTSAAWAAELTGAARPTVSQPRA